MLYAVILEEPTAESRPRVADALVRARGLAPAEAAAEARAAWGLVAESLDKDAAEGLRRDLEAAGEACLVVPQGLIEDPPEAVLLGRLDLGAERLGARLKSGEDQWHDWKDIDVMAAAGLSHPVPASAPAGQRPGFLHRLLNLGLRAAMGLPPRPAAAAGAAPTDIYFVLDIILRAPPRRLRVDSRDFDFSGLRARMSYSTVANFRSLVMELAARAPSAARNQGAEAVSAGRPLAQARYGSLDELARETRRLLTLRSLKI